MVAVLLPTLRHFRLVNIVALMGTTYTTCFIVALMGTTYTTCFIVALMGTTYTTCFIVPAAAKHGITPAAASSWATTPCSLHLHTACQPMQPQTAVNNVAYASDSRLM